MRVTETIHIHTYIHTYIPAQELQDELDESKLARRVSADERDAAKEQVQALNREIAQVCVYVCMYVCHM
jgi:hypothetical protein